MIDFPEVVGNARHAMNCPSAFDIQLSRRKVSIILDPFGAATLRLPLRHCAIKLPKKGAGDHRPTSRVNPIKGMGFITEPIATRLEYRFRRAGADAYFVGFTELWDVLGSDVAMKTVVADWRIANCDLDTVRPLLDRLGSNEVVARFDYRQIWLARPPRQMLSTFFDQIVQTRLDWCASENVPVEYVKHHEDDLWDVDGEFISVTFVFENLTDAVDFELHWGCGLQHVVLVQPQRHM
ncbi:hypothetical protein ACW7BJ_01785 [Azospirillum argentinense]